MYMQLFTNVAYRSKKPPDYSDGLTSCNDSKECTKSIGGKTYDLLLFYAVSQKCCMLAQKTRYSPIFII